MYSKIYRAVKLFWPGGWTNHKNLQELQRMQWLSSAELEAWKLQKIQHLVQYAYEHVPFYRERYQREDIHPADIKSLKDFQALPFLSKEDIKNNLDKFVSPELRRTVRPNETGGSTGQPIQFYVDSPFWRWNVALRNRARAWYGVHEGDKMALVWGAPRDMPSQSWKRQLRANIMRHRVLNAFYMTEPEMQAFAEMLVDWQPTMIKAYPSALCLFAEFIKQRGITGIRPRLIETTSEKVTQPQRELLEEVFACPVADCYSSREFVTIAYECELGKLHVCETRHLEIVDNGQVVEPGQLGEVIITSLHQLAMPFIRYRIGDMAIYDANACSCGRGLPVLRDVAGRTHDFLVTADGHFVHGEFFAYTFRVKPEVVRYQIYQPDRNHLEVRLVCNQGLNDTWLDDVQTEIQSRFGHSTEVSLQIVNQIELTPSGKHRYIISDVKPGFV